jgi:hypothetical protein
MVFCIAAAQPAQADFMEFLFPSLKNQKYDPTKTMKAPFAEDPQAPSTTATSNIIGATPQEHVAAHLPHRSETQIAEWVTGAVANALTFEGLDAAADMQVKSAYFSPAGLKQFQAFLEEHKLTKATQSKQYVVRAFVNGAPDILNEGAVDKRYRWLVDAPIMISIMEAGLDDYRKAGQTASQEGKIQVQIGRVDKPLPSNPDGLVIETWKGTLQPAKLN